MGVYSGPNAINNIDNDLVLYLDAGNIKSYTTGSSLWYDLSNNNNDCSVINPTLPFTYSAFPGSLTFPSIGQTSTYIITSSFRMPTSSITIEVWAKFPSLTFYGSLISYATSGNTNEFIFFFNNGLIIYGPSALTSNYGPIWTIPSTTEWYQIVRSRTISTGLDNIYINGVLINSRTWDTGISQNIGGTLIIGQEQDAVGGGLDPGQAFTGGSISICKIYNRALSSQEVFQNYNALKSRFDSFF